VQCEKDLGVSRPAAGNGFTTPGAVKEQGNHRGEAGGAEVFYSVVNPLAKKIVAILTCS